MGSSSSRATDRPNLRRAAARGFTRVLQETPITYPPARNLIAELSPPSGAARLPAELWEVVLRISLLDAIIERNYHEALWVALLVCREWNEIATRLSLMDVVIIGSDDVQRYERVLQKRIRRGGEHPRDLCRFMLIQIGGPPIESLRHLTIDFGISHPSDLVEFLASLKCARHLVSLDIRCGTVDHMKAPLLEFSMDVIAQAQSDHIDRNTFGNLKSLAVDCGHEQMVLDIMLRAQNIQHIRISTAFGILPFIPHTLPNFRTLCLQLRNGKKNYGNWNLSFAFGRGLLSPQEDTPKMLYMEGSEELTARWRGDIREVKKLCEHHDVPVIWRKRFEPPKYKEVSQVGAST